MDTSSPPRSRFDKISDAVLASLAGLPDRLRRDPVITNSTANIYSTFTLP